MRLLVLSAVACFLQVGPGNAQFYYPYQRPPVVAPYPGPPQAPAQGIRLTLRACEGQYMGPCGGWPWTGGCGTLVNWAVQECGRQGFRYLGAQQVSSQGGNRCGYGYHNIMCGY